MLSGRLEEALEHYQKATELADGGRGYLLTLWGMAVTLDRLGEHEHAIEHIRKALASEGGRMTILRSDGVFFEPEHEIHYYEGLGHEALAGGSDDPRPELRAAAESFRTYLSAAGEDARFFAAASSNLERIERLLTAEASPAPRHAGKR
jgi:tetratricopeptide (TPR) repeat protein